MKFILIALASLLALANCQTYTSYCPSGQYSGYVSTAFTQCLSPVTGLSTTSSNYAPTGLYRVTAANGADQCCYNCATQTSGTCTTWTYDGCGNCYLSSATGSSNYLTTSTGGKSVCSGFASGFVSASSSGSATTTVASATTTTTVATTFNCQVVVGQNSPNTADTQTTATDASACCNKCGSTSGCIGFAFLTGTTACWLKTYNPTGASNLQNYSGMIIGGLSASG